MSFESPESIVRELTLFVDNDGDLYRQMTTSILKNLATHKARGDFSKTGAEKAFMYLAEAGAKKYAKEFGSPGAAWHTMFSVPVRKAAAKDWAESFERDYANGEYDHLLPKKYQPKIKISLAHIKLLKGQADKLRDKARGALEKKRRSAKPAKLDADILRLTGKKL